jgi:hypothetical protein
MGYKRLDSMLEGFCDTYGSAVAWIRNNTIGIIERSKKYEGLEEKHGPGLEDKLKRCDQLASVVPRLIRLVQGYGVQAKESMTRTKEEMVAAAEYAQSKGHSIENWERSVLALASKKVVSAQANSFKVGVTSMLAKSPQFQKIPVLYHDPINHDLILTDAASKLLGLGGEIINIAPVDLVMSLKKEYRGIVIDSIKHSENLRHCKVETLDGKKLQLGITYFNHAGTVLGSEIVLYDILISTDSLSRRSLARKLKGITQEAGDRMRVLEEELGIVPGFVSPLNLEGEIS